MQTIVDWQTHNYTHLVTEIAVIRQALINYIDKAINTETVTSPSIIEKGKPVTSLDILTYIFKLSTFERQLLLLCIGIDLDPEFATLCAKAHGNPNKPYPSLHLALSLFKGNWSALAPDSSLIYWQLLRIEEGTSLTSSPIRLESWTLFLLTGQKSIDHRLVHILNPIKHAGLLLDSYHNVIQQITKYYQQVEKPHCIQLISGNLQNSLAVTKAVADKSQFDLYELDILVLLKATSHELKFYSRLLLREALLSNIIYFINYDLLLNEEQRVDLAKLLQAIPHSASSRFILHATKPISQLFSPPYFFQLREPTVKEQIQLWQQSLNIEPTNENTTALAKLVQRYPYEPHDIQQIGTHLLANEPNQPFDIQRLWQACHKYWPIMTNNLVEISETKTDWHELILAEQTNTSLKLLIDYYQHHYAVLDKINPIYQPGITACFIGPANSGKTLAVKAIATKLSLPIWQLNLHNIISSYVENKQTFNNLLNDAKRSGAILLFDRCDDVLEKCKHADLYTYSLLNYLIERLMESPNLCLFTARTRQNFDRFYLQNFNLIINFDSLDEVQRLELWQKKFASIPAININYSMLSKLPFLDAHIIHNCALAAIYNNEITKQEITMQAIKKLICNELIKKNIPINFLDNYF